jgi:hypothetical protein
LPGKIEYHYFQVIRRSESFDAGYPVNGHSITILDDLRKWQPQVLCRTTRLEETSTKSENTLKRFYFNVVLDVNKKIIKAFAGHYGGA